MIFKKFSCNFHLLKIIQEFYARNFYETEIMSHNPSWVPPVSLQLYIPAMYFHGSRRMETKCHITRFQSRLTAVTVLQFPQMLLGKQEITFAVLDNLCRNKLSKTLTKLAGIHAMFRDSINVVFYCT